MKVVKILHIILLLFIAKVSAQEGIPEPFVITSDTATMLKVPENHWQYLREDQRLTIKQVSGPEFSARFIKKDSTEQRAGNYWIRYRIKNDLNKPLGITIPEDLDVDTYISAGGTAWQHFRNGSTVPWSKRDGLKRIRHILYTIPARSGITVYERLEEAYNPDFDIRVGIKDNVIQEAYIDNYDYYIGTVTIAFVFGFLIFAALVNFFFYYIIREKVYLIYAIMLVTAALSISSDAFFNIILREAPALYMHFIVFVIGLFICLLTFTVAMFLGVPKNHPRWYRIIAVANVTLGCCVIANFMARRLGAPVIYTDSLQKVMGVIVIFLSFGILVTIVIDLFKKRRSARLFIVAVLPFLLCIIYSFLFSENSNWFSAVFLSSIIWAVSLMSWSLFDRFRKVLNENMQQALDKERLAREKEEERNALIAQQNEMLEKQVAERTSELTRSLSELKQTQNQLIQSEKMASLGELTAGIAHEIQNPLNFVNNFSDVSVELLQELKEEADKGDLEEVKAIADDVAQNLQKIAHHGRRADGIVKGMLQHSRASSGQKEPTDINALADEYLRLAYHGLRAKDKSFNAELVTHFDENLPKVNVIPQDVGRVLLNLFTNAFYATQENSKQSQSQSPVYKPTVTVTTQQKGNSIEIIVNDNGTGIPDAIKDKILQPFFTTKPTGEGTGLGLSLSYDIVVKGHGGSIDIESREGEGSTFIIRLSI